MRRLVLTLLGALAPLALATSVAHAETVMLSGPGDFSGSESLVTFDDLSLSFGDPIPAVDGVTFDLDGMPATYFMDPSLREFDPQDMGAANNFLGLAPPYPDLTVHFPELMTRVGFQTRMNPTDEMHVLLMRDGEMVDELVAQSAALEQFFFYGYENTAGFDEMVIELVEDPNNPNGLLLFDNLMFESVNLDTGGGGMDMPMVACEGFLSPLPEALKAHPRHYAFWEHFIERLPVHILLARMVDGEGASLGDMDLPAAPVVRVHFSSAWGGDPVDVTADVVGSGSDAFEYDARRDAWHMMLRKRNMHRSGTYSVTVETPDEAMYSVDPTCTMSVTHHPWWHRFVHRHH